MYFRIHHITSYSKKKQKDIDTYQKIRYYVNVSNDTQQKQKIRKRENEMNERVYYSAAEIAQMLGVSMGKAYKILREMNQELAAKGYLTIAGKIPVEYFKEKWYGAA